MRLAHLADLHLGFRQFYRQTPAGINQREADVANAFRAAVDGIIAARPDAILIAGDLFHAVRPTNYSIVFAFRQFQRILEALPNVKIVAVAGNHDTPKSSETGSILKLYEELGISIATEEPHRFSFPELGLSVFAVPHAASLGPEKINYYPDGSQPHEVLLIHRPIQGLVPPDHWSLEYGAPPLDPEVLRREKWSYVAMGHYHVMHGDRPHIWYPGSLEYIGPNLWGEKVDADMRGVKGKGWLLVDLGSGKAKVTPQFVPPARTVFDTRPIEADGLSAAEIDKAIAERLHAVPGGYQDAIVRVRVRDIPRQVQRELDHAAIRQFKAAALHLQLNFFQPEAARGIGITPEGRRQTLPEIVKEFLKRRPLPERIFRERFVAMGLELLDEPDDAPLEPEQAG